MWADVHFYLNVPIWVFGVTTGVLIAWLRWRSPWRAKMSVAFFVYGVLVGIGQAIRWGRGFLALVVRWFERAL